LEKKGHVMNLGIGIDASRRFAVLALPALLAVCHMPEVNAQTQASQGDCLEAAKLKLEAQAFQEFLRPYAAGSQTFAGPSFPDHDSPKGDSLQEAMREFITTCRSGGSATCDAYAAARNAMYAGSPPNDKPDKA